ncbi:hypothetical protein DVU_2919 [Nitratidesulfovibrio vulgaris str. Hildenborough]|uniref:Uncharacterized protein n=1 Tax=Nitratidesulfovibrio vulgaris (strain ATCC 29579 / DSM 644 / CCUG 34227 / NCIMB 8303 / VKM B-1760 / Hildenborough) TaxID=882 RepID=Q727D6_NITV2|nr:hypothetical protein DVU_2919 [Nitratidesulfovibrio vulgaris str. Hildenborough]
MLLYEGSWLGKHKNAFFRICFQVFFIYSVCKANFFSTIKVFTCALGTVSVGARLPRRGRGSCLLYCCVPLASPTLTVRIPSVLPAMVLVRAGACACALCPHWACFGGMSGYGVPDLCPEAGGGALGAFVQRQCPSVAFEGSRKWPSVLTYGLVSCALCVVLLHGFAVFNHIPLPRCGKP